MNIRKFIQKPFNPEDYYKKRYVSPLLDIDFVPFNCGGVIKLEPVEKAEMKELAGRLNRSLPGKSSNYPFLNTPEFYTDKNYHQLYSAKFNVNDNTFDARFRTPEENPLLSLYLDALQDAAIARQYKFSTEDIDHVQRQLFGEENINWLMNNKGLLREFEPTGFAKRCLKFKVDCLLDAIGALKRKGYDSLEVVKQAKRILVHPTHETHNDPVLTAIQGFLS